MKLIQLLQTALFTTMSLIISPIAFAFTCPVETENFTLSNGAVVGTPLCYSDTLGLTIEATANLEIVNKMLEAHHVYAVPMNGKAMVQLSAVHHRNTNIGPYKEIVIGILATNDKNNSGGMTEFFKMLDAPGGPLSKNIFIFGMAIWVDTEVAKLAGPEIWGLEKSYGDIAINQDIENKQSIAFNDAHGPVLSANWNRPVIPFPQFLDTYIVSPTTIKQTKARAWFSAIGKKQVWNKKTDTLNINERHPFGAKLIEMGFTPTNKIYIPRNKSILFAP